METKTVKISEENYKKIRQFAGELQKETGSAISVDKALTFLLKKTSIKDLAGGWKMSDKEADELMESLKKGWSHWKKKYV